MKPSPQRAVISAPVNGARLPAFIGGPEDAAARLGKLRTAIVGTGSIGGRIAPHLVRLGIAELWLVDGKTYKPESMLTHDITGADVGHFTRRP